MFNKDLVYLLIVYLLRSYFGGKATKKICNQQGKMKVFSNKREKMCVFFKSRGVIVALFLLYLIYI